MIVGLVAPAISFSEPSTSNWYSTDQTVSWTIADTAANDHPANGVADFSRGWDISIVDPYSEATPGSGNAFYSGPQYPNATSDLLMLQASAKTAIKSPYTLGTTPECQRAINRMVRFAPTRLRRSRLPL